MLQKLNERIQGIVAWVVIVLIAVTFTLFGVDYYMQSHQSSDVEVTVNGESISKQAYEVNYRRIRQQKDPAQLTLASENNLKKQVLEDMIVNLITVQGAKHLGFTVSPEQANSAIVMSIPQFQEDGHFSAQRYQQALNAALYTPDTFQKQVQQGMLLNQQRFAFMGSTFALPNEIDRFVKLYMQTRNYDFIIIPAQQFVAQAKVSDNEIDSYYKEHAKEFITPEKVSLEYVRLSTEAVRKEIHLNDEQIKAFYEENQSNFLTPAQWRVAHILFAVPEDANEKDEEDIKAKAIAAYQTIQKNPAEFTKLVKKLSADKLSAAQDGILPWIVAGTTTYDKYLAKLTKPGEISSPIKTDNGYELFKLVAYKPANMQPLNQVKEEISKQLSSELVQARCAQLLEQLTDLSYQTPDSLEPVAQTLKLNIENIPLFSRQGEKVGLASNKQIINAAFSHDVLDLGNNSEPIQADNDSVIVLRIKQHNPAAPQALSQVKDKIQLTLINNKASEQAQHLGNSFLTAKDNNAREQLLKNYKLNWKSIHEAARDADVADAIINQLAFSIPAVQQINGQHLNNGDFVLVRLTKVTDGNFNQLDKEQQASLTKQIEASYGVMDYDLYSNSLINQAKIERN